MDWLKKLWTLGILTGWVFGLWILDFRLWKKWTFDFGKMDFGNWTLDFEKMDFELWKTWTLSFGSGLWTLKNIEVQSLTSKSITSKSNSKVQYLKGKSKVRNQSPKSIHKVQSKNPNKEI